MMYVKRLIIFVTEPNFCYIWSMKTLKLIPLVIAGILPASCGKDNPNPVEEKLVSKPFTLSVTEVRQQKTFTWEVDEAGGTDNYEEAVKELYATRYNTVTLRSTEEVNVKSLNPAVVAVTRADAKTYTLEYKGDGTTTIEVWNGEGTARCEKRFGIHGQEYIDVEGLRFTYGGEKLIVKHVYSYRPPIVCQFPQDNVNESQPRPTQNDFLVYPYWAPPVWRWDDEQELKGRSVPNPHQGTMLVFEGLYPENTSFRTISAFESEWACYPNYQHALISAGIMDDEGVIPEGKYNWPNEASVNKDCSEYVGTKQWLANLGNIPIYMACIKIKTDKKTKYLCLTHGKEDWPSED